MLCFLSANLFTWCACAPLQALGPYSVSKTALLGLTRALAPELAQSNIRVNCVAPGIIKTRFSSAVRTRAGVLCKKCGFCCISVVLSLISVVLFIINSFVPAVAE